ncbi:MAG: adenylate/guanylate cyclase domain-containing protein [Bifidobacteriaceae bacterium]|jgi:adenylate cyclase|nr:adenylate/guanylate cyclase domain-containing protein [Bifidobacteriaceae bacterium]
MAGSDLRRLSRGEYSTAEDRADAIVGAPALYTVAQVQQFAAVSREEIDSFMHSLGLPMPRDGEIAFSVSDISAIIAAHEVSEYGVLGEETEAQLLRAVSHTAERLAWWQFESLVDDAAERYSLDGPAARLVVLDRIADMAEIFAEQMMYAWRRHLSRIIRRVGLTVSQAGPDGAGPSAETLPLQRAVGFADLVGYTAISAKLGTAELDLLVQAFMRSCRDIVSRGGGRVVKELGDGIMFVTDEPLRGAAIALDIADEIGRNQATPPARVGLVWGRVLGRFGDVFGPTVNLASRLTGLAAPSEVLVDSATARSLEGNRALVLTAQPPAAVPGVGSVTPYRLMRSGTAAIQPPR